jgi:hypothetical protein
MSPPGIAFFYAAFDEATALAELRGLDGEFATVAQWVTCRPTYIVDFARLPQVPSIFNRERAYLRPPIRFLHSFVREISKPVRAHDDPSVDYVPTQVVAEYIRHCIRSCGGEPVEGIMYPSAVRPGGTNLVFFPPPPEAAGESDPLVVMCGSPRRFEAVRTSTEWRVEPTNTGA